MKKIVLFKLFKTDTLRNRERARQIFRNVKDSKLTLDFRKISFISKSFAHEVLSTVRKKNLDVKYINVSSDVQVMLDVAFSKPTVELKIHKAVDLATC